MLGSLLNDRINRRLMPLYTAHFFEAFALWYAIEKVYMDSIGFNASLIGVSVAVMAAGTLLLDLPLGILADRWSRKGVLILAVLSFILCSVALGATESVWLYIVFGLLYSFYSASHSGVIDSIIYDVLLEENGNRKGFEKYYGYGQFINGIGLVLAGLVSSLVVHFAGVREAYFWSVLPMMFAFGSILIFREPILHKSMEVMKISHQLKRVFNSLLVSKLLMQAGVLMCLVYILMEVFYEMDQLWPLALAMPLVWYGPLNSALLLGHGIGGPLGHWFVKYRKLFTVCLIGIFPLLALLQVHNMIVIGVVLMLLLAIVNGLYVYGQGIIHDGLASNIRSSASSAVSMLGNVVVLPSIIVFGWLVDRQGIFSASNYLLPIGVMIISVGLILSITARHRNLL